MARVVIKINGSDVSDYVARCGKIPYIKRNRDFTPVFDGFEVGLFITCPVSFTKDSLVEVLVDSSPVYLGYVYRKTPNNSNRTIDVEVMHYLTKLADFTLKRSIFETDLYNTVNSDEYIASDNESLPNAAVSWIVKQMFTVAGIELVTTNVDTIQLYTKMIGASTYYWNWTQLVQDVNMLFSINQPVTKYTTGDGYLGSYLQNYISFLDYVTFVFGLFGFSIKYTGNTTNKQFTLMPKGTPYTINDDVKYDYESEEIYGLLDSAYGIYQGLNRTFYSGVGGYSVGDVDTITSGTQGDSIWWYKNFVLLLRKQSGSPSAGDVEQSGAPGYHYYGIIQGSYNFVWSVEKTFIRDTIHTEFTLPASAVNELALIVDTCTTEIAQEVML